MHHFVIAIRLVGEAIRFTAKPLHRMKKANAHETSLSRHETSHSLDEMRFCKTRKEKIIIFYLNASRRLAFHATAVAFHGNAFSRRSLFIPRRLLRRFAPRSVYGLKDNPLLVRYVYAYRDFRRRKAERIISFSGDQSISAQFFHCETAFFFHLITDFFLRGFYCKSVNLNRGIRYRNIRDMLRFT